MTITNTGLTEAGLRSEFQDSFEAASQTVLWPQLTTTLQSNKDEEKYAWMGATPPLREWGTGRVARPLYSESYSVKNLKYEATIEVDRDEISDDQTGSIRLRTRELAARAAGHKDKLLAELISNGHSAGFNAYDGKPFSQPIMLPASLVRRATTSRRPPSRPVRRPSQKSAPASRPRSKR
jgi:phage major head subunit gpT-like protein